MPTLVINTPRRTVDSEGKRSFENTIATGEGLGFAPARNLYERCRPGGTAVKRHLRYTLRGTISDMCYSPFGHVPVLPQWGGRVAASASTGDARRRWWLSRTASVGRRMGGFPPSPHDPPFPR